MYSLYLWQTVKHCYEELHFWLGVGNIYLTDTEFRDLVKEIIATGKTTSSKDEKFTIFGIEFNFKRTVVSLYSSPQYDRAFGSLTVFTTPDGTPVAAIDFYDFDPKDWGKRSTTSEVSTGLVDWSAPKTAKPFYIIYPISLGNKNE